MTESITYLSGIKGNLFSFSPLNKILNNITGNIYQLKGVAINPYIDNFSRQNDVMKM